MKAELGCCNSNPNPQLIEFCSPRSTLVQWALSASLATPLGLSWYAKRSTRASAMVHIGRPEFCEFRSTYSDSEGVLGGVIVNTCGR